MIRTIVVTGMFVSCLSTASSATAAARVQLELVGESNAAALDFQQWARTLDQAGIRNVRFRSSQGAEKVGIETLGSEASRTYVVTGVVRSGQELVLPLGRVRRSDVKRLAKWLDDLAEYGPDGPSQTESAFGLTAKQFERVEQDLAAPVTFSTKGVGRVEVVERLGGRLSTPLRIDRAAAAALGQDQLSTELVGISTGTALAYALRPAGYCLVPQPAGGVVTYNVVRSRPGMQIWPVGFESQQARRDVVPAMFEFHNINVQGVTATVALDAISKILKVPYLVDHNACARHGIDPEKAIVSHPRSRTTYSIALRRMLVPAGLKFEVRVDENDSPFLWITTVKPL